MLPGQERPLSPNLQSWVMRFWKDTETENKQSTPMCAQLCMQGEGGGILDLEEYTTSTVLCGGSFLQAQEIKLDRYKHRRSCKGFPQCVRNMQVLVVSTSIIPLLAGRGTIAGGHT